MNPDGVNPDGVNPDGVNPDGANPDGVNVRGANPDGANPDGVNVRGANARRRRSGRGCRPGGREPRTCRDRPGPVVAVCGGDRCAALHRRAGSPALDRLRAVVRAIPGAVLVSTGCLGRCDVAAVVLIGWTGAAPPPLLPLAGMADPVRAEALVRWLQGAGPACVFGARSGPGAADEGASPVGEGGDGEPVGVLPGPLADAHAEAIRAVTYPPARLD